jgi:transketolase
LRKVFQQEVSRLLDKNSDLVLLLGDIGVYAFREEMKRMPSRVLNVGILEQAMTSFAAGLALEGKIPIVHTIAPFLIERPFEQLKVDFGYQDLPGNFISVGASFDYSTLGATHQAPGDIALLLTIPGFDIFLPSTKLELSEMLNAEIERKTRSYFRLTTSESQINAVSLAKAEPIVLLEPSETTLVAFGPSVDEAYSAALACDAGLVYVNRITASSIKLMHQLLSNVDSKKIVFVQPFYEGTLSHLFISALSGKEFLDIGIPRSFSSSYGTREELEHIKGLSEEMLQLRIKAFLRSERS